MHSLCMATKTISLRIEAYEKLAGARRFPGESFSQVVLRGQWNQDTITGGELLDRIRRTGPTLSEESLDEIEALKRELGPPVDKWSS